MIIMDRFEDCAFMNFSRVFCLFLNLNPTIALIIKNIENLTYQVLIYHLILHKHLTLDFLIYSMIKINQINVSESFSVLERYSKLGPREINITRELINETFNLKNISNFPKRFCNSIKSFKKINS